jgi:adenosylmethionine-8-amino-7-oxononanoate aminotransferase
MSHILHRHTKATYPTAVGGAGPYLIDSDGKRYLDASGGAAVSCLGHSHRKVIEAVQKQVGELAFAHTSFFTNRPAETLADHLIARAPEWLSHVYYVTGGSEANEAAIKLARQYHVERGEPQRTHFIARRQSYHGNTIGALSIGASVARRAPFLPLLMAGVSHVEPCYAYRHQEAGESDEAYGRRAADALEAEIRKIGEDRVCAFFAETVVGATAGCVPPAPGYFKRIREICDRYGVLLVLDEVMSGMGRTGTLFACEQDGIAPDIVTCAKGLGAGYQPVGAMLLSQEIYDAIAGGSGFFQHGHTYISHATALAGALAVQQAIEEEDLLANVRDKGAKLRRGLEERFGNHHHVGDIRGRGLFIGLELVQDRATKEPFDPSHRLFNRIKAEAMQRGLVCYPGGGTADGKRGDHVLLAPPFVIEDGHVAEIVDKLGGAVDAAIATVQ